MRLTDHAIEEIITDAVNVHKMKQKEQTRNILIMAAMAHGYYLLLLFIF